MRAIFSAIARQSADAQLTLLTNPLTLSCLLWTEVKEATPDIRRHSQRMTGSIRANP
jgi:hypothetical protein